MRDVTITDYNEDTGNISFTVEVDGVEINHVVNGMQVEDAEELTRALAEYDRAHREGAASTKRPAAQEVLDIIGQKIPVDLPDLPPQAGE